MSNNLLLALEIAALGMGFVFGVLILIWWMMALLTRLTAEKDDPSTMRTTGSDSADSARVIEHDHKALAAAIAVAAALAEQRTPHAHILSIPPTAIVSAWQLGMRTRQLSEKGTPVVRKPRKVG